MKRIINITAGLLLVLLTANVQARPTASLQETFEAPGTVGTLAEGKHVAGGQFKIVDGRSSWRNLDNSESTNSFYARTVDPGVDFDPDKGTFELVIRYTGGSGLEYGGSSYNTLFSIFGLRGDAPTNLFVPSLVVGPGNDLWIKPDGAIKTWGDWLHVGPRSPGDVLTIHFSWDSSDPSHNIIVVDGKVLNPEKKRSEACCGLETLLPTSQLVLFGSDPTRFNYREYIGAVPAYQVEFLEFNSYSEPYQVLFKPSIDSLSHDAFSVAGYSGKLVAGDTFTVNLTAEPGGTATFDLVQPASTAKGVTTPEKVRISRHEMTEDPDNPGTYRGIHIVKYGEDAEDGLIVGRFTNSFGLEAEPVAASRQVTVDTRVYMEVKPSNDLIPADEDSRAGITIVATDANGRAVRKHPLNLSLSTTDEYTGTVGGGTFEDQVGGSIEVDWKGVTDSFGEVTAQYISGFAAKTIVISARDMETGDVGVGYIRSFIDGTVDIVVKAAAARALAVAGSMEVTASRDWLTADGVSRSRITAVVKDASGKPVQGDNVQFNLLGDNGTVRVVRGRTDSRGRAVADYVAGTKMGLVQIQVQDVTRGLSALVQIELRPDAPAEIALSADPAEVFTDDTRGSVITAKVTDINGNPNTDTDVLFEVLSGGGTVSAPRVATDERDGAADVTFLPGGEPGVSTIRATVMSRHATSEEMTAAEGAVFLYGLEEEPVRLEVLQWLAEPGDEVVEGQNLLVLEDRDGMRYPVKAPRDGIVATFVAEEGDRVEYGKTLGYVLPLTE